MNYYYSLLYATLNKDFLYLKRYWVNTVFSICILCLFFFIISFCLNKFNHDIKTQAILSGYIVWAYTSISFSSCITNIMNEASLGTLEQLYINSKSFYATILMKGVSAFLISFTQITSLLLFIAFVNGLPSNFFISYLYSIPIFIISLPSIWGISLAITSFALKYKNVISIYTTLSSLLFALLSYFSISFYSWLFVFIPFGTASYYTQYIMNNNTMPSFNHFYLLIINSIIYYLIGILLLRKYEKISKNNSSFGHH